MSSSGLSVRPSQDDRSIALTLVSKKPKSKEDWVGLDVPGLQDQQTKLLDSHSEVNEGVFCEKICFTDSSASGTSLSQCKSMSNSPEFQSFAAAHQVDVMAQPQRLYRQHRSPGLAVFDMDSTLIQQEVIDELARKIGKYDQVAAITEAAMRGELDFEASLRSRVGHLQGVPCDIWEELKKDTISFTPGAKDLTHVLKQLGWKLAVLSGGFMPLAVWVKETLGLDYAFANQLVEDGNTRTLTGDLVPDAPIVDASRKRELLSQLASDNSISPEATVAVGDGSNDLLMLNEAGLGIAFNAKPKVQAEAPLRLNSPTLLDVMYLLGYTKQEVEDLISSRRP